MPTGGAGFRAEEAISGEGIFAREQTAGKGRRGKNWMEPREVKILLTPQLISLCLSITMQQQFRLSIAVALGCFDFFSAYIKENIKIKWPNDIFINDRKAGGILIENVVIKGNLWQWAIIGIGLNINQENFGNEIRATSLKQITGIHYDVIELANELLQAVINRINQLKSDEDSTIYFINTMKIYLRRRNKMVKLKKGNIVFETTIEKISSAGELITQDVIERRFEFDEK